MARYRTVKPDTFADERLALCSIPARYLFIGLWCFADDRGVMLYSPSRVRMEIFPGDEPLSLSQVEKWLGELLHVGVIKTFQPPAKYNRKYIYIPNFLRHQKINRPSRSSFPPPPGHPEEPQSDNNALRYDRNESSLRPHGLVSESSVNPPDVLSESSVNSNELSNRVNSFDISELAINKSFPHGALSEHSVSPQRRVELSRIELSRGGNTNPPPEPSEPAFQTYPQIDSYGNRLKQPTTEVRELLKLAGRMIEILGMPVNRPLSEAIIESIRAKAKSEGQSFAASAQQIMGKAALARKEAPPDNWLFWFRDARYNYVSSVDKLAPSRQLVRRSCGSADCLNGWRMVKNEKGDGTSMMAGAKAQRCEECKKLWVEDGEASSE